MNLKKIAIHNKYSSEKLTAIYNEVILGPPLANFKVHAFLIIPITNIIHISLTYIISSST